MKDITHAIEYIDHAKHYTENTSFILLVYRNQDKAANRNNSCDAL